MNWFNWSSQGLMSHDILFKQSAITFWSKIHLMNCPFFNFLCVSSNFLSLSLSCFPILFLLFLIAWSRFSYKNQFISCLSKLDKLNPLIQPKPTKHQQLQLQTRHHLESANASFPPNRSTMCGYQSKSSIKTPWTKSNETRPGWPKGNAFVRRTMSISRLAAVTG